MRRLIRFLPVVLVAATVSAISTTAAGQSAYSRYLTAADVAKVTGMKGVTMKPSAAFLHFFDARGGDLVDAHFSQRSLWDTEMRLNAGYYETVPGVGEKAAISVQTADLPPYRMVVLKGQHCVVIDCLVKQGKVPLTKQQLIELGRIVAGRL